MTRRAPFVVFRVEPWGKVPQSLMEAAQADADRGAWSVIVPRGVDVIVHWPPGVADDGEGRK